MVFRHRKKKKREKERVENSCRFPALVLIRFKHLKKTVQGVPLRL
jgi:hypothetical protein